MSQEQHPLPVKLLDGKTLRAIRTGNNAAWLCVCSRAGPLIGYSDELDSPREYSAVICPDCRRIYRVVAPGLKKVPTHVQEVKKV